MEGKQKKKLRLTKKQFLIGIIAICGLALVIEVLLIAGVFSKRKPAEEPKPGQKGIIMPEKPVESYSCDVYETKNGERRLVERRMVEADASGRVVHTYVGRRGDMPENMFESVTEELTEYDEQGRIAVVTVKETYRGEQTDITGVYSETIRNYTYKNGILSRIKSETTKDGRLIGISEEQYDDHGVMTDRKERDFRGKLIREMVRKYDEYYNFIGSFDYEEGKKAITAELDPETRILKPSEPWIGDRYHYDEQWRLIRYQEGGVITSGTVRPTSFEFEYSGESRIPTYKKAYYLTKLIYTIGYDETGLVKSMSREEYGTGVFDWEAEDPDLPGRKVLRVTETGQDGSVRRESYYLIRFENPVPEDRTRLSYFKMSDSIPDSFTYTLESGTWEAELYSRKEYEEDVCRQTVRTSFDANGNRVKTVANRYRGSEVWEYDDHGNLTRHSYGNFDDENSLVIEEYEYTYD